MRQEKTIDFGHMTVKVHEPTVEQIRNLLGRDDVAIDPIGFFTGKSEISPDVLALVTDLTPAGVAKLYGSELKQILEEASQMLRPFFDVLEMLGTAAGYLGGMQGEASKRPAAA